MKPTPDYDAIAARIGLWMFVYGLAIGGVMVYLVLTRGKA